jgi:hypothetical protein
MRGALAARGVELREVIDLELEDSYVELMRAPEPGKEAHAAT